MKTLLSFEQFVLFIREEVGEFKMTINQSTLIEDDLGVTGDDAVDLLNSYTQRFGVDMSGFVFDKYFYPEPNFFRENPKPKLPITIGDMYQGIAYGKLDDSVIGHLDSPL